MFDSSLSHHFWFSFVCFIISVTYVSISVWYTEKYYPAMKKEKNNWLVRLLDNIFNYKYQSIAQLNSCVKVHTEWFDHRYVMQKKDQKMVKKLVTETIQRNWEFFKNT